MEKLLFISNLFPDQATRYRGLDNAVLLSHLQAHCRSIRAIALRPTLSPRLLRLDPFTQTHWQARPEDAALRPLYLPVPYLPKVGGLCNDHLIRRRLAPLLRRLEQQEDAGAFDTILASWVFPDGCAVARLSAAASPPHPTVLIAQGSDIHQYLRNPLRRKKILRALRQSCGLITRSARLSQLCENAGADPAKLHPVYNGVDLNTFHPAPDHDSTATRRALGLPAQAPIVLFVGNFLPVKNPLLLLESFAAIDPTPYPEPPLLLLIGSGPLQKSMEDVADAAGISDDPRRLRFLGRKEPAEVAEFMRAADCLALSSHNEGVPNVILESFASGLPILSTDVGGIHEVWPDPASGLQPVARLVPPGDLPAFTGALADIIAQRHNTALREALAKHGKAFSWQITAAKYHAILTQTPAHEG